MGVYLNLRGEITHMVLTFLLGLILFFCTSKSKFGNKWGHIIFPIYLIFGLFLFSIYSIGDGHYYIGAICLLALLLYSLYKILEYRISKSSDSEEPDWLPYLSFFPVLIAIIALFCLPNNYISFQDSNSTTTENESVYYSNCTEAKYMGAAPIYRDEPGYRSELDRDNDGVACE